MRFSTFQIGQMLGTDSTVQMASTVVEGAVFAEQLGFDVCWVGEHHFSRYGMFGSPMLALAAIAAKTTRIKIAPAVAVVPFYHPLRLAEDLAVLDALSGGRLIAGVGPGFAPLEFAGFGMSTEERRDRFFEGLDILVRAWTEPVVSFHGTYFQVDQVEVLPKPVQQPHPQIVHAATKPESQVYAAQLGRPILVGRLGDDDAYDSLRRYVSARREAGHDEASIARSLELCGVLRHVCVSESSVEAQGVAKGAAIRYLEAAARLGLPNPLATGTPSETPEDLIERGAIVGSVDEVTEEIGRLHGLGVQHLICWFDWGGIDQDSVRESMRLFASEVMPQFAPKQAVGR